MGPKKKTRFEEGSSSGTQHSGPYRSRMTLATRRERTTRNSNAQPPAQQPQQSNAGRRRRQPQNLVVDEEQPIRQVREIPAHHLDNKYEIQFGNQDQMSKYDIMFERGITPTRFLDAELMDMLGLGEDLRWMYERLGIRQWWDKDYDTYPKYVYEFFSSVEVCNHHWDNVAGSWLKFRCDGVERVLSARRFYGIYGFREGGVRKKDSDIRSEAIWPRIADDPVFHTRSSKCSLVKNPVFRCFQKSIANTFLARADSQNVMRAEELYFIWACFELDDPIDFGYHFLAQISSIASKKTGRIAIGGMLTPLFRFCDVDLTTADVEPGPTCLGLDIFEASGLFRTYGPHVYLCSPLLRLPCDRRIRITDVSNWKVGPAADVEEAAVGAPEEMEIEAGGNEEGGGEQEEEQRGEQEGAAAAAEEPFDMRSLQFSIRNIGNDTRRILQEMERQNQLIRQLSVRQTRVENRVDSIYYHFYPQNPPSPPQE